MRKSFAVALAIASAAAGVLLSHRMETVQGRSEAGHRLRRDPGTEGRPGYLRRLRVVKGWPKDISTLPGNEKWTWGAGQSVYAESPNRVFMLFRGELPNIKRPADQAAARVRPEHLSSPSAACPGAMRPSPRCPARAAPARIP